MYVTLSCWQNGVISSTIQSLGLFKVVPTVLPSGTLWDFDRARLHIGGEQLQLQGIQYKNGVASTMSNNQLQDLAGNASEPLVLFLAFLTCSLVLFQ